MPQSPVHRTMTNRRWQIWGKQAPEYGKPTHAKRRQNDDGTWTYLSTVDGRMRTPSQDPQTIPGFKFLGYACLDCEGYGYYPYLQKHKGYDVDEKGMCLRCASTGIEPSMT